jgi:hypothetical protein
LLQWYHQQPQCCAVVHPQICDVGLAIVLNDRSPHASVPNFTFSYAAPELLLGDELTLKVISYQTSRLCTCCPGGVTCTAIASTDGSPTRRQPQHRVPLQVCDGGVSTLQADIFSLGVLLKEVTDAPSPLCCVVPFLFHCRECSHGCLPAAWLRRHGILVKVRLTKV